MPVYDDIVFPTDISFHSPGGPAFLNKKARTPSGYRQVDIKRDTPLCEWDVAYGAREVGKIYDLYMMFNVMRGSAHVFLFKFWLDYKSRHGNQEKNLVTPLDQLIAVSAAGQTQFQLIKTYTVGSASMVRTIYKPRPSTLRVSVDGVEELAGWTMDASTGIITRASGLSAGQVVRAGYEYYFPTAFSEDVFESSFLAWETGEAQVMLEEIRLEAAA